MTDDERDVSDVATAGADQGPVLVALYDRALPQIYGYLLPRCGSVPTAEDLTAETFLAAVSAVKRRAVPDLTVGWLVGVARHKLVDHFRRQARDERLTLRYLDGLAVPQVADHLGRTVHATEALLVRARTAFRRAYEVGSDADA